LAVAAAATTGDAHGPIAGREHDLAADAASRVPA
jgi:hypothetical protein